MKKKIKAGIWEYIAGIVLRNRVTILVILFLLTVFLAFQWKNVGMTYNEANLLPKDHPANKEYTQFLNTFGEEGNLIVIGIKDDAFFTPKAFAAWNKMVQKLKAHKEIELVVSISNLKKLEKDTINQKFQLVPLINPAQENNSTYLTGIKNELFNNLPFYEGLLFNKKSGSIRAALYMNKKMVNSPIRKNFILNVLVPAVDKFEKETNVDLKVSGMPYIRTINTENMKGEIGLFIGAALFITSLIFFLFFPP